MGANMVKIIKSEYAFAAGVKGQLAAVENTLAGLASMRHQFTDEQMEDWQVCEHYVQQARKYAGLVVGGLEATEDVA